MTLARDVFQQGHYEAAYHLLNAALHYAKDLEHDDHVRQIQVIARDQHAWVNRHAPDNAVGAIFYPLLLKQAEGDALIIHEKRRRHERSEK